MNRRAFLGSGLMSLLVGVFAVLMGGIPGQSQRLRRRGPVTASLTDGDTAIAFGQLKAVRLEGPANGLGKPIQEGVTESGPWAGTPGSSPYADLSSLHNDWQKAIREPGYAVPWDAPTKPTPLADMRRIRNAGRQFGLG